MAAVYDSIAIELAEQHNGVTSVHLLRQEGATSEDIRWLRRSRHWRCPSPRTFVRVGSAPTEAQALTITVLDAGPGAFLSHLPSARWWGSTGCAARPIHVVRTVATRSRPAGVVVHQIRQLPAQWTTCLRGVPVVRPELCALHLFAVCRQERAERLVDGLWSARLLSGRSLGALLAQLGEMGRNGTAGLRAYLDDRPGDYVPPASGLESRVADILRSAGITVRRQVDLGTDGVWSGRVDFLVEGQPIVIEVQSERHHAALSDRRSDAARRAGLEAAGFVWVEVWDHEVWGTPALVVARVRAAIDRLSSR